MNAAPMYDESLLHRYRGIVELSERGVDGERETAQRMRAKMQRNHPHIHVAAYPPEPLPSEDVFGGKESSFWAGGQTFEDFFGAFANRMKNGASWAARAAYEAMQIETARQAAEETVEIRSKILSSGKWQAAVKIELDQLDIFTEDFTQIQSEVFADAVADRVRDRVLEALGYEVE